jgi:hypothetical protein
MPIFNNPEEQGIWDAARIHERERVTDALKLELLDPNYEGEEFRGYRLGLRMAIAVIDTMGFDTDAE